MNIVVICFYFFVMLYHIQLNNCEHSNIIMEAQLQALNATKKHKQPIICKGLFLTGKQSFFILY